MKEGKAVTLSEVPPSNNSMDVRAKQLLCYQTCVVTFGGLGGGFAPRQILC